MYPPYNKLFLLATGGSATERAKRETPASDAAQIIDLTGGPMAPWIGVGPMPYKRILGDAGEGRG